MIAKGYVALLSLYLALAPGCGSSAGNDQKSPTPQPAAATSTAAVPNESAAAGLSESKGGAAAAAPARGKADACRLLTSEDVEAVQGEGVKDAKGSEHTSGPLTIAQCFYTTASFNKSVSLTLTQKNADSAGAGGLKEIWEKQFGGESGREKKREQEEGRGRGRGQDRGEGREGEEEEGERPAQRVKGVGDEAYWVGTQKVGALYVLKGDRFLRISIGGPEEQKVKIEKMKSLAKRALKRL